MMSAIRWLPGSWAGDSVQGLVLVLTCDDGSMSWPSVIGFPVVNSQATTLIEYSFKISDKISDNSPEKEETDLPLFGPNDQGNASPQSAHTYMYLTDRSEISAAILATWAAQLRLQRGTCFPISWHQSLTRKHGANVKTNMPCIQTPEERRDRSHRRLPMPSPSFNPSAAQSSDALRHSRPMPPPGMITRTIHRIACAAIVIQPRNITTSTRIS